MAVIVTPDDPRDLTYDRQVARQFARLTSGWRRGAMARRAWLLTIALATLVIANIGVNLGVNQWNRVFFDALERRDGATLGLAVAAFAGLVVVIAGIGVLIVVTRETLQVRWREWLLPPLTGIWVTRARPARAPPPPTPHATGAPSPKKPTAKTPQYRIADESRLSTEPVVDFAI